MIGNLAKKGASLPYIEGLCDFLIKAVEKNPGLGGYDRYASLLAITD